MTNDLESIKSADTILVIGSNTTEAHPVIGSMIKERVRLLFGVVTGLFGCAGAGADPIPV